MIEIVTSAEITDNGKIKANCNIKNMEGKYGVLVSELATILQTVEDEFPGMIGDAFDLLIKDARRGR